MIHTHLPRHTRLSTIIVLCLVLPFTAQATEVTSPLPKATIQAAIAAAEARLQTATKQNPKIDPLLATLLLQGERAQKTAPTVSNLRFKGDNVQVYIKLKSELARVESQLQALGADIEVNLPSLNQIQAWVPISAMQAISELPQVSAIFRPAYASNRAGRAVTQGDVILKANALRAMGITGKGIKVGIISDGANSWTSARNSGDLPQSITVYGSCTTRSANPSQCSPALTCNEGTAMAEIIHDLAPDADLAVAAVSTSMEFISQANRLANTFGANIIVDDLGFYGEPYFADGDIANAVAGLPADVLYVSSAGNSAASHYERNYQQFPGGGNVHNFGTSNSDGADDAMGFLIPPNRGTVALLQWDENFNNPSSNYDLYIFNANGQITQQSAFTSGPALEAVCVPNTSSSDEVRFAVVNRQSGAGRKLEMFFLGAGAIEYEVPSGSIFGHPGVTRALAIGTTNAGSNTAAFYSSRGPAQRNRAKPDLTGVDGVSVTGAGGFPSTFFGTSAAAPHVAGVAALLMSASRKNTTALVRQAMLSTATDLGSSGRDSVYGYGRVNADAAIKQLHIDGDNINIGSLLLLLLED